VIRIAGNREANSGGISNIEQGTPNVEVFLRASVPLWLWASVPVDLRAEKTKPNSIPIECQNSMWGMEPKALETAKKQLNRVMRSSLQQQDSTSPDGANTMSPPKTIQGQPTHANHATITDARHIQRTFIISYNITLP